MLRLLRLAALLSLTAMPVVAAAPSLPSLLPVPHSLQPASGSFALDARLRVEINAPADSRVSPAVSRFVRRLRERTGLFIAEPGLAPAAASPGAVLRISAAARAPLSLGDDERYRLEVKPDEIRLDAPTDLGVLRGLETLLQLLGTSAAGYALPAVVIEDQPRFPWRGLMIDSARHFLPVEVLKRNLDGMAAVKLNVLHWHLTDDQGFRIESKRFPQLHLKGSDGDFYTHEQVREVLAYADARGIRVYPEFDIPGHATAWLVGHPELASIERTYQIERGWGIFDPALDPTKAEVYALLDGFFEEMAGLFTDPYLHIGGDEVNGKDWAASPRIQAYMREHQLADGHALQRHFNERILKTVTRLGKKMIGWDEIFQPGMPTDIVIHSWRGREAMEQAAKLGYQSILSNGYYIDLMQPASFHYLNDPLPADSPLSPAEAARVLGGEATMWSEHVTPETVDSRIWPRTAAIAERLWADASVRDVEALYRRLEVLSVQLEEHGLTHLKNRGMLMRRLVGTADPRPLEILADVVEPVKLYARNEGNAYTQHSPYTLLPDIAVADAPDARAFREAVRLYQKNPDASHRSAVRGWLERWRDNHAAFTALAARAPALREALPLSEALHQAALVGLATLEDQAAAAAPDAKVAAVLARARQPVAKVELQVVDAIAALAGLPAR